MSSARVRFAIRLSLLVAFGAGASSIALGHIQLVSPNGGEALNAGQLFPIQWLVEVEHDLQDWDLWYSTASADGPWMDVATNLAAGDPTAGSQHSFDWLIPNISAPSAWVRVRQDNSDQDYYDVSDMPFSITGMMTVACDFTSDGQCRLADLNALLANGPVAGGVNVVPGVTDEFDLDDNGRLDESDVDLWLSLAGTENGLGAPYQRGDANLDGVVNRDDFVQWSQHKFTATLRWDEGDFSADGFADGADLLLWNAAKSDAPNSFAVPEPVRLRWWGWIGLPLIGCFRKA